MKKGIFLFLLLSLLLIITGCANTFTIKKEPYTLKISTATDKKTATLGTYCWTYKNNSECVDKGAPRELVKQKEALTVKKGAEINFIFPKEKWPNRLYVTQIYNEQETDVTLTNGVLVAPTKKGEYIYGTTANWDSVEDQPYGDVMYVFKVKVE